MAMGHREFIFIIALLMAMVALTTDAMLPALSRMALDFGVNGNAIQLVVTSVFVGHALGQLVYGPVSDTYGRKRSIFVGLGIFVWAALLVFGLSL